MTHKQDDRNGTICRTFPRAFYAALTASVLAILLVCWTFFSEDLATAMPTAVVTIFALIWLIIPIALWRQIRGGLRRGPLRDWLNSRVEVWQTRLKGWDAAVLALLPPLSVAVGLALLSLVAQLAADDVI